MKLKPLSLLAMLSSAFLAQAQAQLTLLSNFSANQGAGTSAGEIVSFDKNTDRLFVTSSNATSTVFQVNIFDFSNPSSPSALGTVDFSGSFGNATNMSGLSSVCVDPLGRFGVAALIPTANTTTVGKVGFFNLATGALIGTADAGYHPDSVTFSADGSKLVVVNEGEFNAASPTNAPGSLSVFDVSAIHSGNLATLNGMAGVTTDFTAGNLSNNATITGLRNSNVAAVGTSGNFIQTVPDFDSVSNVDPNAIEPEYASVRGNKVYVSLQDNNAIGEYDLTTNKWSKITELQLIAQLIDATDTGSTISINQTVNGMPMPDTVATYTSGGKTYVVTANEGDARVDDRDISRFGDVSGADSMTPILDDNYPATATGVRANAELGRLNISRIDGDTDADGKIDSITMLGTRSFSIWEVTDSGLALTYDSGSFFEQYISLNDPSGWVDGRSDDKGPEPEGLTLGTIDGETYAFIGMERTNSIFMFNVTNPAAPNFTGYIRVQDASTPLRPEGMAFIPANDSPNGQNLLVVGFEGDGTAATERIAVFSVVPEPSTYALMGLGGLLVVWTLRRKRTA